MSVAPTTKSRSRKTAQLVPTVAVTTQSNIQRAVNRALEKKLEHKYLYHQAEQTITSSGFNLQLSDLSVSTGSQGRVGNDVRPVSLEVQGGMEIADTINSVRLLVYRWKPDNTVDTPSIIDLLNLTPLSATLSPYAAYDQTLTPKWIPLIDEIFAGTAADAGILVFRKKIQLPPSVMHFIGSATTGTDQLYMSLVSDSAASSHPVWRYSVTFHYTDA